ncbi:cyclohexanecarboxylate-CoA ligase [Sphaerisporangium album]|uniref:Cyclohexanecarboxylate-CoA ligase n=1 Tax=Sphaerisporangium album TaxID=509200 RepID=A0A367FQP1_9ACTN|nr:AMP-binding protein [Sphaerisporangium album]RCG32703.1 cyclohexanecarboxylate-CoA ligase [Sphaerisporangium album]
MRELIAALKPPMGERAEKYYAEGWWRGETFADDLRAAAAESPEKTAFVTWRHAERREVSLTYGALAGYVTRLSEGLRGLGVEPGDAVAFQLPNWWETAALNLACLNVGAISVPLMMTLGAREMELILSGTEARVCVAVAEWDGRRPAERLAATAGRLPGLRHRVTIGADGPAGTVPFGDLLGGDAPADAGCLGDHRGEGRNPDEVSVVLFTSGTTGEVKGVLHTPNTQYASARPRQRGLRDVPDPRVATPANLTHSVGMRTDVLLPLVTRTTSVFADTRDPDVWLDLMSRHRVTHFLAAPEMLRHLVAAQRGRRRPLPCLRVVTSSAAPLHPSLVAPVRELLCPGLVNGFGMTETGGVTITAPGDPPDWPGHSIGRPAPGREVRLLPGPGGEASRLQVRGPSVCVGTFALRDLRTTWTPDDTDGWFDTGDLVREDGRGGLTYLSRAADRVGSPHPIPVLEVEDELLRHPAVADVAVIGCGEHGTGAETVCAVVVPDGPAPDLGALREHLARTGMTEWYLPTRLECVDVLPRNELGKVRKNELRARFAGGGA